MFQAARKHIRSILTIGVASALVVGGVASAQSGAQATRSAAPPPGAPPIGAPQGKDLTYAQIHVQENGQEKVLRIDQGKIAEVSASSITLTENDGSTVKIALNEETKVLTGPGQSASVSDLSVGETVEVCGPEDGPAKSVMVPPKPGQVKGLGGPGQMPAPPLAPGAEG